MYEKGSEPRPVSSVPQTCPVCHNEEHLEGARFCMICGSPLDGCQGCAHEGAGRDQDYCWNCSRNGGHTRSDRYTRKICT